jgi:peptide/nickel transport system ATP-binding protein
MPDAPLLQVSGLRTVFQIPGPKGPGLHLKRSVGSSDPGKPSEAAAVDNISFQIARGETLGLVGESGSGKSVTALSIIRLVTPPGRIASGKILFDGRDLLTLDEESMRQVRGRRIGFVFQEPMVALSPVYTIGWQIRETLQVHDLATGAAAERRAVELLEAVRVPDPSRRAREYPYQLSGGLRQRAMLALALAAEPSLLIADEPTTALDVTVQAEVLDLLRDLRKQFGLSLLLITHDLGVVAEMADRVAVMYCGRIVEEASTAALLSSPAHPYTRGLIASIPSEPPVLGPGASGTSSQRLVSIPGTVPPLGRFGDGCTFSPRCPDRFEPCPTEVPGVTSVESDHTVRCHLHSAGPATTRGHS